MPATPQDHRPAAGEPFKFTDSKGKSHTLPTAEKGRSQLTGRELRDAALGGEAGMVGYLFRVLEAAEPSEKALNALYDLPQSKTMEVLRDWADHGDGDGASLGE